MSFNIQLILNVTSTSHIYIVPTETSQLIYGQYLLHDDLCNNLSQIRTYSMNSLGASTHLTPASSTLLQLCSSIGFAGQSISLLSVPMQFTLSSQIMLVLLLVKPVVRTVAPASVSKQLSEWT